MEDWMRKTKFPRFLLAAAASGSGKTLITCGILQALKDRGLTVSAFKCGPDYIDPMFHEKVLCTKSRNLDGFFTDEQTTRYLFAKNARDTDISVIEGVMGYYDGLGGVSEKAGAYDLACATGTPAVLIVDTKGMSLSVLACIKGFLTYRKDSHIRGVILNRISPMLYPRLKERIEAELPVRVFGYVPPVKDCVMESRHLGLVKPDEIAELSEKLKRLAKVLEKTLNIDGLLALAGEAENTVRSAAPEYLQTILESSRVETVKKASPVLAVARDEAFCFLYEDNLQLMRELGLTVREFSPLHDTQIPKDADGLLLCGGYPELYAEALSANTRMKTDVREKVAGKLPCLAECGGFLYLHETLEDMEGNAWKMAGVILAKAFRTEKLTRFGYIELEERENPSERIRAHEFHYFDSTDNGTAYIARKPFGGRSWNCIHKTERMIAGFPHLYYYSNPEFALRFAEQCAAYQSERNG